MNIARAVAFLVLAGSGLLAGAAFAQNESGPDLSIELDPVKCESRVRIRFELMPFLTLVIGKKYETIVIKFF